MLYRISVAERGLTGIANIFRSRLNRLNDLLRAGTVPLTFFYVVNVINVVYIPGGLREDLFLTGASDTGLSRLLEVVKKNGKTFESSSEDLSHAYKSLDFPLQMYRPLKVFFFSKISIFR